jgi:hypothetical protein
MTSATSGHEAWLHHDVLLHKDQHPKTTPRANRAQVELNRKMMGCSLGVLSFVEATPYESINQSIHPFPILSDETESVLLIIELWSQRLLLHNTMEIAIPNQFPPVWQVGSVRALPGYVRTILIQLGWSFLH